MLKEKHGKKWAFPAELRRKQNPLLGEAREKKSFIKLVIMLFLFLLTKPGFHFC